MLVIREWKLARNMLILMLDIPVCGEYKTGTINRQSHTK